MSDKDEGTDIWEHPLTDQTFCPADNGMVIEPGKSDLEVTDDKCSFDKLDRIRLEQLKLQQTEAEEEIEYQIKRLELERQRSRMKFERELARLKSVDSGEYYRVDEEVKIRSTLNSGIDFTSLNDMLCKLDLPKIELPYFDGDSSEYHYFIREFETQIESRVKSDSQRLSYLLHYCRGRAKRAISGCVMLSGPEGYSNARSILSNMFGRPHVVAKSLLDKITSGKPVKSSSDDLWELSIEMRNCQTTLSQMSYTSDLNSHLTIERVARRLPFDLQRRWVERASEIYDENREPLFRDLIEFVIKRARVAGCRYNDMLTTRDEYKVNASNCVGQKPKDKIPKSMITFNSNITKIRDICPLCKLEHALDKCPVFSSMTLSNRWRYILRCKRCLLCLLPGHMASDCEQSERCGQHGCNESHHRMLHRNKNESSHSVNAVESTVETSDSPERVSLGIIAVNVIGPKDCRLTYALIDNGSDSTFISRALADTLGITGEEASVTVRTLNSVNIERSTKVSFTVESIDTCEQVKVDQAFTIARLNLGYGYPLSSKQLEQWKHLTDIKLNDLGRRKIELLIGCNTPEVHWSIEQRIGNRHQPFAVKSVLGWTLFGPLGPDRSSDKSLCLLSVSNSIDKQQIKIYNNEFEDIDDRSALSVKDLYVIRQVTNSVSLENGHFVVGVPWKIDKSNVPDNIAVARRRLSQLKKRFVLNSDLFEKYKTLIQRHFDFDYSSRGLFPPDDRFMLLLNGPLFLRTPFASREVPKLSVVPEGCELKSAYNAQVNDRSSCSHNLLAHYSSLSKLQRAVVWLTRFKTYLTIVYNLQPDSFVRLRLINVEEMEQAVLYIITLVKNEYFWSEKDELMKHGECTLLTKLNPLMHDGILILGLLDGAQSSQLGIMSILPSNHVVTELIIPYYHELEGHAGLQQVLSTIRKHFWIVKGASVVKRVLNNCARYKRLNAQPLQQQMPRLPECRITPGTYAFDSCGVDYFGPLFVQQDRSVMKRWGCLFTCMRSRAVHIEIVHTLLTGSFLKALIKFINRRGYPKIIFSYNDSKFIDADTELKKELALLSREKGNSLLTIGIQWYFNPPGSNHRGGVWERLIRSTRKILGAISNEQIVRDEVLLTTMTEVEHILNNRPLLPVYNDVRDALALFSNDIILLRSIKPVFNDASIDLRRYTKWWNQALHLPNIFLKRWVRDYLSTLELQQKWLHPKRNLKVGDIVLVVSDIGSKDDWPLGRAVPTYPSEDGLVREVDVITKQGKFQRDIRRLCFLEGHSQSSLAKYCCCFCSCLDDPLLLYFYH